MNPQPVHIKSANPQPKDLGLSLSEKETLSFHTHQITYQKGEIIIKQDTPVTHAVQLKTGMVKIIKESANGKYNILDIVSAGQYIGMLSLISNQPYEFTAIAIDKTTTYNTDGQAFKDILNNNNTFANSLLAETGTLAMKTINRLVTINNKQLPGRVADVILYFHKLGNNNSEFEFPLSRAELAQFAGTTKESFIRTLTEFKNDKIINIDSKKITINSMEIIETLSRLG